MKRARANEQSCTQFQFRPARIVIVLMAVVCLLTPIVGLARTNAHGSETVADSKQTGQWRTIRMRVTAYCPCEKCCGEYADGITASGHKIRPGDVFVAADRRFALGARMIVPEYNNSEPVKILDRGGAIKGNRLDVFFGSHQQALNWGVKHLDVKIPLD